MSDTDTAIFTDDDSVDKEIAENETRDTGPRKSRLEHSIERVISPLTRVLQDPDLTPEEAEEAARQNDREQGR